MSLYCPSKPKTPIIKNANIRRHSRDWRLQEISFTDAEFEMNHFERPKKGDLFVMTIARKGEQYIGRALLLSGDTQGEQHLFNALKSIGKLEASRNDIEKTISNLSPYDSQQIKFILDLASSTSDPGKLLYEPEAATAFWGSGLVFARVGNSGVNCKA